MSGPRALEAKPTVRPDRETFRVAVGPGRNVDVVVPRGMTESELLILVSSIAGPMRQQIARPSGIVVRDRRPGNI